MKRIQDLTVNDFPGVDPQKFEEWKKLAVERLKMQSIVPTGVIINIFVVLVILKALIPWFIIMFCLLGYKIVTEKKVNPLEKELGITKEALKRALQGVA